jgi:hypothetical protein
VRTYLHLGILLSDALGLLGLFGGLLLRDLFPRLQRPAVERLRVATLNRLGVLLALARRVVDGSIVQALELLKGKHAVAVGVVLDEHVLGKLLRLRLQLRQQAKVVEEHEELLHVDGPRFVGVESREDSLDVSLALLRDADRLHVRQALRHLSRVRRVLAANL